MLGHGGGKRTICGSWFSYDQEGPEIKPRSSELRLSGMAASAFIYPAGSPVPRCFNILEFSSSREHHLPFNAIFLL